MVAMPSGAMSMRLAKITASGTGLTGPFVDEAHRDNSAVALLELALHELEFVVLDVRERWTGYAHDEQHQQHPAHGFHR